MRSRWSTKRAMLVTAIAASAIFGVIAVRDVNFRIFASGVTAMDYRLLLPSVGLLTVTIWLRAVRWRLMFMRRTRPPRAATVRAVAIGLMFNQILPFRGGDALRVLALSRETGASKAESLATTVAERVYDVLTLLVILFAVTPFLPHVAWIWTAAVFAVAFAVLIAAGVLFLALFGERAVRVLLAPLAVVPQLSRDRTDAIASRLADGLQALHQPRGALAASVVSALFWATSGLSYWFVLEGFGFHLEFHDALFVLVATNLALVLPSLPAGVGVFEAATLVALESYSIDGSRALACAVVLHAVNFFPYIAAGLAALYGHSSARRRGAGDAQVPLAPSRWSQPGPGRPGHQGQEDATVSQRGPIAEFGLEDPPAP